MGLRKLTREEIAGLKVGDKVAVRYFDPSNPHRDKDDMTTDRGHVVSLEGDPLDFTRRTVIVEFPTGAKLDYFGSSLLKEH